MAISRRNSLRWFALLPLVCVWGCSEKPPVLPTGIPVPNGWRVLKAETNKGMSFEGTAFYARFESPDPPDKASLDFAMAMVAGAAKGFDLEGPVDLSVDEMQLNRDHLPKFDRNSTVDRSRYPSGSRVYLSSEPSYYEIYAYPHKSGSIVELLNTFSL